MSYTTYYSIDLIVLLTDQKGQKDMYYRPILSTQKYSTSIHQHLCKARLLSTNLTNTWVVTRPFICDLYCAVSMVQK